MRVQVALNEHGSVGGHTQKPCRIWMKRNQKRKQGGKEGTIATTKEKKTNQEGQETEEKKKNVKKRS